MRLIQVAVWHGRLTWRFFFRCVCVCLCSLPKVWPAHAIMSQCIRSSSNNVLCEQSDCVRANGMWAPKKVEKEKGEAAQVENCYMVCVWVQAERVGVSTSHLFISIWFFLKMRSTRTVQEPHIPCHVALVKSSPKQNSQLEIIVLFVWRTDEASKELIMQHRAQESQWNSTISRHQTHQEKKKNWEKKLYFAFFSHRFVARVRQQYYINFFFGRLPSLSFASHHNKHHNVLRDTSVLLLLLFTLTRFATTLGCVCAYLYQCITRIVAHAISRSLIHIFMGSERTALAALECSFARSERIVRKDIFYWVMYAAFTCSCGKWAWNNIRSQASGFKKKKTYTQGTALLFNCMCTSYRSVG